MKKKQTAKVVDLRTRAGRTLKRKRAAMQKAREARWASKRRSGTLTAREVIASLPSVEPTPPPQARPLFTEQQRAEIRRIAVQSPFPASGLDWGKRPDPQTYLDATATASHGPVDKISFAFTREVPR